MRSLPAIPANGWQKHDSPQDAQSAAKQDYVTAGLSHLPLEPLKMGYLLIAGLVAILLIIMAALRRTIEPDQSLQKEDADHLREQIIRELARGKTTSSRLRAPEKPAIFTHAPKARTDKPVKAPAAMDNASITRGLIIDEPWISKILSGEKTWEMRSTKAKIRGPIALIKKGSGTIVGVYWLIGTHGPFDNEELRQHEANHRIPSSLYQSPGYKWRHAWVLGNATPLAQPVPYRHTSGAVIWVKLNAQAMLTLSSQLISHAQDPR